MEETKLAHSSVRNAGNSMGRSEENAIPTFDYEEWKAKNQQHPFDHVEDFRDQQVRCPYCGRSLTFSAFTFARACDGCGRTVSLSPEQTHRHWTVQGMLPFQVSQTMAQQNFDRWIRRQWKVPEQLRKNGGEAVQFKGYFVPFWSFEADTEADYRIFYRDDRFFIKKGQCRLPNLYNRVFKSGKLVEHFDNVLVPADNFFNRSAILDECGDWDFEHLVPFDPKAVEGYTTEQYTLTFAEDEEMIQDCFVGSVRRKLVPEWATYVSAGKMEVHTAQLRFKLILLPLWSGVLEYGNESCQFVVNGRTGRVAGTAPVSERKVGGLAALVVGLILVFVYWNEISAFLFG